MKKLISLLAALAVVSTCTMSAFAFSVDADNDATTDNNTAMTVTTVESPTKYEADATTGNYTVDASVAGTQDQTTILAVKGDVVRLGSIEYIDQSATQSFSFALRNELAAGETVNVLVGGSNGTVYNTGYMQGASESTDPEEPTTYTVSGTVGNIVDQDSIDENIIPFIQDVYEGDDEAIATYIETYCSIYATRVKLYNKTEWLASVGEEYLACFESSETSPASAYSALVDSISGKYELENVANGDYVLAIERDGALPYLKYITVDNANYTMTDTIDLYLGDFIADYDIGSTDALNVLNYVSCIGDDAFDPRYDLIVDGDIGSTDAIKVLSYVATIWDYDEQAIYDLLGE